MSGHSHWAGIKHKKAIVDAKRGKVFTKLARYITVAARQGGGNPDMNAKLRLALEKARLASMPRDNIERAIKKGTGEGSTDAIEEITYEGYGPGGVAVLVEALTDNRNRTAAEVRRIFELGGGNMGGPNSVSWMFEKKGLILLDTQCGPEDRIMELALEAGASDFENTGSNYQLTTPVADYQKAVEFLKTKNITPTVAEITNLPNTYVEPADNEAVKVGKLINTLDDNDDVQNVYTNCRFSDTAIAQMQG